MLKNIFMIQLYKKWGKITKNVSIYFIYVLVENLSEKKNNILISGKSNINSKYLNNIKNFHDRTKLSHISYDEYIKNGKNSEKKKHIKNCKSNIINYKNNLDIKNPGIRLYEQNKEHETKKLQKLKEKLEEEKKLEDMKLTFKPKINEYSRKLVGNNYNGIKIENRLINLGKIYKAKNKSKQNNVNDDINKSDSNNPTLNINNIKKIKRKKNLTPINNLNYIRKSKNNFGLVKTEGNSKVKTKSKIKTKEKSKRNLTPDKNLYEYLYLESKILKKKKEDAIKKNLDMTCPFKPKLNDSFNKDINNDNINVFQRLYNTKNGNRKIETEMKLKRKFNFYSDDNTNDYLNNKNFKKNYNVKTYNNKPKRSSSKDDNSYINSINKTINNDNNDKNDFYRENKKNYFKKSYITILKAKYIKYFELFNSLDSDKDGIISYKKIKLSNLDSEKLICLTPIFYEIQYKRTEIDFPKFCEILQNSN